MRAFRAIATLVLAAVLGSGWAAAATKSATERVPQPLGNNPHPVIWSSTQPRRPTPPPQPPCAPPRVPDRHPWRHDGDRHHDCHARPGVCAPYYWYYPYCNYGYGPSWDSLGLGAAAQDAMPMAEDNDVRQPWPNRGDAAVDPPLVDDPQLAKTRAKQAASERQNELASKNIGYGDALFAKQKYAEANQRYRTAARSAPQLASAWFRQGFALAAIGRSDQAAVAIKRGLKLDPAWAKSDFDLDQLFGGNAAAKRACLDALTAAVAAKPTDADRLFVLGVVLHFDGEAQRAAATFAQAEQLAGNNLGHIAAFVTEAD